MSSAYFDTVIHNVPKGIYFVSFSFIDPINRKMAFAILILILINFFFLFICLLPFDTTKFKKKKKRNSFWLRQRCYANVKKS